jgi:pimeloyl-ACP methyl ester carboxylesterase
VPVGMAVQCLIAGLLVLAIFPIKALRDLVGAAQRVLASVVGDSFIFVTSPVQEAAIISKFQRDLRWLSERCEKVVVVAHSQGAAVAYKGLERLDWDGHMPEQVKLLVTLGSGLRKLVDLEQALERPAPGWEDTRGSWRSLNSRAWTVIALSLGVLGGLVSLFLSVTNPWVSALTIALCLPALALWLGSIGVGRDEGPPPLSGVFWHDYYSSHDPVPNGALLGDFDHP